MDEGRVYLDGTRDDLLSLFNCAQEMLAIVTIDWRFQRANVAWKRIIGREVNELQQTSLLDLIYPDDLWLVTQELEFIKKQKTTLAFTARCMAKDGSVRWLRWNLWPASDRPWIYVGAYDITDHVTAIDELAKSNEMLTSVLLSAPVATWAVDMEGRVQFWNEAAEQTLGWTAEEVLRGAAPQFLPGSKEFDPRSSESFAGKEVLWHRKDGFPKVLRVWTAPLHDGSGIQCGILGMSVDVTPVISLGPNSSKMHPALGRR
jgi:PAS domain S-box-containing protein